jgi:hypothetical protein
MYENVKAVAAVLEGTPTGKVLYNGEYRNIPKTRLDTFVSLLLYLVGSGKPTLGIITGYKQADAIEYYVESELAKHIVPEEEIRIRQVNDTEITIDDAIKVKEFLLEEGLDKLPFYLVTSEEHMRQRAYKNFDVCFGDDIKLIPIPSPLGVEGVGRIKTELHEIIGKPLDGLVLMNVDRGDHNKLAWKREMFWPLRKKIRGLQSLESINF